MNKTNKEMEFSKYIFPKIKTKKWKKIRLIDTTNKKIKWSFTGGPFGSNLQSSDYTNDGIRVIQLQNIGDGVFNNDYKIYTSEKKANELLSCNIYPNEILISKMGDPVGRACIVPEQEKRYVMCSDGIRLVVDEDKYSKDYIYYAINSEAFRLKIFKNSTGSTRRRIGLDILKNLEMLILKEKEEQEKIAECLKSIDDLLLQEEDKLEKLKSHKNGLLQKLFPQDNKCMPELRFKRYNQKWEKMTFDNLLDYERPEKYIVESTNYESSGTPVLTANKAFILGYSSETFGIYKNVPVILFDDFTTDKKFVDFPFKVKSSAIKILKPKGQNNLKFIFEIMNNTKFTFTEHKRYYISTYKNIAIFATKNKQEQQKIAECLLSIDNLISAQTRKIELLKQHKKGLLQGLFPSIEEVENE